MNLGVGIVGLPNVGKSTLFNALLRKQQALVANYPFATIEPNIGVVPVPDVRLGELASVVKNEKKMESLPPIKNATVNFVDIAGLVQGAAGGAGLGNKFLSHIREVNVICHVVRAFTDDDVIREGSSDPESDYASITTELILADLDTATNHMGKIKSQSEKVIMQKIIDELNTGNAVRNIKFTEEEMEKVNQLSFLTAKPEFILLNVNEDEYTSSKLNKFIDKYSEMFQLPKEKFIVICAKIEAELASLSDEEQREFLASLDFGSSGLERVIQKAYSELGLISFLTAGEKEVKAWTLRRGSTALRASGEIHTDFMKKFIKAEVVNFDDYIKLEGWKGSREAGKARLEGKEYLVKDGDVIEFKIGS